MPGRHPEFFLRPRLCRVFRGVAPEGCRLRLGAGCLRLPLAVPDSAGVGCSVVVSAAGWAERHSVVAAAA